MTSAGSISNGFRDTFKFCDFYVLLFQALIGLTTAEYFRPIYNGRGDKIVQFEAQHYDSRNQVTIKQIIPNQTGKVGLTHVIRDEEKVFVIKIPAVIHVKFVTRLYNLVFNSGNRSPVIAI